tara:strand:+ start:412 stop:2490 length:2079 start_codon:yes stop_codon:yes gene_type:complete
MADTLDLFTTNHDAPVSRGDKRLNKIKKHKKSQKKLIQAKSNNDDDYTAKDIEVLEGLEPVRKRPGMYVGGTDTQALHHLFNETLDNAMDEAIAGFASIIQVKLNDDNSITIKDNGRGIPIDPHPKFKNKSALEVIFTTLHSGGKFGGNNSYLTAGGLHGVGISVVNALSENCTVEVIRNNMSWQISFSRGEVVKPLKSEKAQKGKKGTSVTFKPDINIFGNNAKFNPKIIWNIIRAKAYLFKGVTINWECPKYLLEAIGDNNTPIKAKISFPDGLINHLEDHFGKSQSSSVRLFSGETNLNDNKGRIEWVIAWDYSTKNEILSYCNTIFTPLGGTHENGLKNTLLKAFKGYGELIGNKKSSLITGEDILGSTCAILSLFQENPEFQGQTKEKLTSSNAAKLVETGLRDHLDHWLSESPPQSNSLLNHFIEKAEERIRKRKEKEVSRKQASRKLRLPGKLADCLNETSEGTELFIVEGDSAGGSAKQARLRETQAVLPLRGKILNVASASSEKLRTNQELADLIQALGCGSRDKFNYKNLRYEKVIIMTDADVDGAHIASLLMTFFYLEMPRLIEKEHLFIAQPPLYRLTQGGITAYAMNDSHKEELLLKSFNKRGNVEISRFKGLGEMPASQLKQTTMDPAIRTLIKVVIPAETKIKTDKRVNELMGRKPELRLRFIQDQASFVKDDTLDI